MADQTKNLEKLKVKVDAMNNARALHQLEYRMDKAKIIHALTNKFFDDVEFLKKVNKITFGLFSGEKTIN